MSAEEKLVVKMLKDQKIKDIIKTVREYAKTYGEHQDFVYDFIIGALTTGYKDIPRAIANMETIKFTLIMQNIMPMSSKIYDTLRGPSEVKSE